MSKKTLGLIIALLILTIVLVIVAITNSRKPSVPSQNTPQSASDTPQTTPMTKIGHTMLSLSPNPVTPTVGGPTLVNVLIDTDKDTVRAVQLEIAYDPKVLTGMTIKPGTFFKDASTLPIGGVNATTGRITFAVTPASLRDSQSGKGTVAVLSFYPVQNGTASTQITILDKSLVTAPALGAQSVLKSTGATTVTLTTTQSSTPSTNSAR